MFHLRVYYVAYCIKEGILRCEAAHSSFILLFSLIINFSTDSDHRSIDIFCYVIYNRFSF